MLDTPQQFATKLRGFANRVEGVPKIAVGKVALETKRAIEVAMGKPVLLIPRAKRRQVKPYYVVTGNTAVVGMRGAAPLIERDTKPHHEPKTGGRARQRKVLNIPGVGPRASAEHPGTKGKHPFEHGVTVMIPKAVGLFELEVHKAGLEVFH